MMTVTELAKRKQSLRRESRARLHAFLQPDLKTNWDQQLVQFLKQVLPANGGLGAAFMALPEEPDLVEPLSNMKSWSWCWPRVQSTELQFYSAQKPQDFISGPLGVKEPSPEPSNLRDLKDCQVVCVPGVAFDRSGQRLGRGKGFYDKALATYKGTKIGVAYSMQLIDDELPTESHDVRMNYVVTEKFILKLKGQ